MNAKEAALHTIQELPDDSTWEEIQQRIDFMAGVRKGLTELDEGKGIDHKDIEREFAEWLSR